MDSTIYNDLYLMLGPGFETLHIRRSNEAQKGFEQFAWDNVQRIKHADLPPDNWMFHYRFTQEQMEHLPALGALRNRDYFRNLLPGLLREGIAPYKMLPLDRALRMEDRQEYLLQPLLNHPDMTLSDWLPVEGNYYDLSLARPLFWAYSAVRTCQGVLLFTPTRHGAELLRDYMQQTANHFFDVQMPQTELSIYQLPAFDKRLKAYADRFPRIRNSPLRVPEPTSLPPEAFAPEQVLAGGMEVLRYDMAPAWENFCRLVFPASRSGLRCTQRNYDMVYLLHIAQTGVANPRFENAPDMCSRYGKVFERLLDNHATPAMIRQKASSLLDSDFGAIRGRGALQEYEQEQPRIPETGSAIKRRP